MKLTEHFTLEELTFSQTAKRLNIDNTPTESIIRNLTKLATSLEIVRKLIKAPIIVTSGYRSPELNAKIGGSKTSMHMKGLAADIRASNFGTPYQLAQAIMNSSIKFDQLILEYNSWVHFGLSAGRWRNQALTYVKIEGQIVIFPGLRKIV